MRTRLPARGRPLAIFQTLALASLTLLLVFKAAGSRHWRMEHDTPMLHYAAYLIDEHGLAPYRDVFETSMPGTLLFHYGAGSLFGYGDQAFRYVDLFLLGCLSLASFVFLKRFGVLVGWAAAVFFPLIYLGKGNIMSLQRDYLGILPLALALCCIPAGNRLAGRGRFAAVGALFAASALIKPHLALGLPIFLGALLAARWGRRQGSRRDFLRCGAAAALGFLAPIALAMAWLWAESCLGDFIDVATGYLPLHNEMTGTRHILSGPDRLHYLFTRTLGLGGYGSLALVGLFAGYHVLSQTARSRGIVVSAALLFLCAAAYLFYPTLAGKFWSYHYMPMVYWLALASTLSLASWRPAYSSPSGGTSHLSPSGGTRDPPAAGRAARHGRAWVATAIFLLAVQLELDLPRYVRSTRAALADGYRPPSPKDGRVDEIAKWLRHRLRPGDTVQPLDWAAGGVVHAMLLARAEPATRHLYDYHFYHHVSEPYIRDLRRAFMADLKEAQPRFIVQSRVGWPRVKGRDTAREFFELETYLRKHYQRVKRGAGYAIYERSVRYSRRRGMGKPATKSPAGA